MKDTLKLIPGPALEAAPTPFVLVDAGSPAENLWRTKGYVNDGDLQSPTPSLQPERDSPEEPEPGPMPTRKKPGRKPKGSKGAA